MTTISREALGAALCLAGVFAGTRIDAQSPVKYTGCLPADPVVCAVVTMWPGADGNWFLSFPVTLPSIAHPGWSYHLYDLGWSYRTPDDSCTGSGYLMYLVAGECGIVDRYKIEWWGRALITKEDSPEIVDETQMQFTAVAPEPTSMSLIALGLAGAASFGGARDDGLRTIADFALLSVTG